MDDGYSNLTSLEGSYRTQHKFDQFFILSCRYHYKVYYVLTVFEQPSLTPDHRYDSSCVSYDVLSW